MSESVDSLQKALDAPTKWVGMYIAAASAVCILAMIADIFHGFQTKKFWFPCKYFSLNAMFLTLLAVAMKPPMDLGDELYKDAGFYAKISSLTFMCMAMVNFMSSLGSMNNQAILTNTIALGILTLTIVGNMWIQVFQLVPYVGLFINELFNPTIFVLVLLGTLVSSAITVPNIKRSLELKYQEMHKVALREEHAAIRNDKFTIANQREEMKKYWVMAETSSPQFVMARSVVSTTSTAICLLATFSSVAPNGDFIWTPIKGMIGVFIRTESAYKWSTSWILAIQSIGIVIGLVAPTLRWFNNVSYKCSAMSYKSFRKEFNIENYWIQTLLDWRDGLSALQIRDDNCRKYFHGAKWLVLNIIIGVQIMVVMLSKVVVFISVLLMTPFVTCFIHIKNCFVFVFELYMTCVMQHSSQVINSNDHLGIEVGDDIARNLSRYVLLLESEPELPETMVKRMCLQADKVIKIGKRQQPKNLIELLRKFGNFGGVREFDNIQVSSLHSQEPQNCWTLPLMTLTSVAIALPNIAHHKAKQLLSSVSEGMSLAKLIDETSDTNGELANVRKAARVSWAGVLLYKKWQDMDLKRSSCSARNSKEILRKLSNKAKLIVTQFKREVEDFIMENPLNWPVKVIAANSMYRICETILLPITGENDPTEKEVFEKLYVMIADIFAACLTNLPHVISTMCHQSAIEKREKSVREAFLLLGKTEGIIELLQQREWPSLNPGHQMLYIDEWRAFFQKDDENQANFTSTSSVQKRGMCCIKRLIARGPATILTCTWYLDRLAELISEIFLSLVTGDFTSSLRIHEL